MERQRKMRTWSGHQLLIGLFAGLFCAVLAAGRAHAATENIDTRGIALVLACDSSGNVQDLSVGVMIDGDSATYIYAGYSSAWETAAFGYVIGLDGSDQGSTSTIVTLEDLGLVGMVLSGSTSNAYTAEEMLSFTEFSAGAYAEQALYCVGLANLNESYDSYSDYLSAVQTGLAYYGTLDDYNLLVLNANLSGDYMSFDGGVVFTEDGYLCGVISSLTDSDGCAAAFPMNYFTDLSSGSSVSGGTDGSDGSETASSGSETIYIYSSPINRPLFLSIFFGTLALLVISTIVYMQNQVKERTNGIPEFPEFEGSDSEVSEHAAAAARLVGIGGYFDGKTLQVGAEALIFGRDTSRCNTVYPAGTKGVSSLHCKAERKDGRLYVTDLGSTYGTFLRNGIRLAANVPQELKAGDAFYLADPTNTFEVR